MSALSPTSKGGGFSILTLAWTLPSLDVRRLAATAGWEAAHTDDLAHYRDILVTRLLALADPRP